MHITIPLALGSNCKNEKDTSDQICVVAWMTLGAEIRSSDILRKCGEDPLLLCVK